MSSEIGNEHMKLCHSDGSECKDGCDKQPDKIVYAKYIAANALSEVDLSVLDLLTWEFLLMIWGAFRTGHIGNDLDERKVIEDTFAKAMWNKVRFAKSEDYKKFMIRVLTDQSVPKYSVYKWMFEDGTIVEMLSTEDHAKSKHCPLFDDEHPAKSVELIEEWPPLNFKRVVKFPWRDEDRAKDIVKGIEK